MFQKIFYFFMLFLLSSCSIIDVSDDLTSSHVPNADLIGVDVISKLNNTIWGKRDDNAYLFIEDSRFAIKKYSDSHPNNFPKKHEYSNFGKAQSIGSQLKTHKVVIYSLANDDFIGFNLTKDRELIVSRATRSSIIIDDFKNNRGTVWDLYIK